jgi:CheY-like chemotaxis protein
MRILVVDDDPLAAEMTSAILEDAGYAVVSAENAVDAMDRVLLESDIGLVISDMNMPLISGIDFFHCLREQGINIPFILLTGDDPAVFQKEEPAIDGFLIKDFSLMTALVEAVARVAVKREE